VVTDLLWQHATEQDRIEHIRVHVARARVTVVFFTLDDENATRVQFGRPPETSDNPLHKLCRRMIGASSVLPGWQVRA
jgi:hypothetical protein